MATLFNRRPSLTAAAAALETYGVDADLSARLARHLEGAPAVEVSHVNPRRLAEGLGLDERGALKLLVAALHAGLVTLHWEVRCPVCGGRGATASLTELHHDAQCPACQNHFAPRLDHEVSITFSVHTRYRTVPPSSPAEAGARAAHETRLGAVSGQALLLLPEFQRLFPQERLLPDESLEVARVALVFTDLAGSTALYAQRGDPRAYHLVRLHFDTLFAAADRQAGVVVKNIGDAVMAAFQTPAEALAAALEMQAEIAALNRSQRLAGDERLILKIGLHSGPCLNVTLNERPDYFGTTVNVAARVQVLSRGGDLVFTDAVRQDPEVAARLDGRLLEASQVQLKGLQGEVTVYRLAILRP